MLIETAEEKEERFRESKELGTISKAICSLLRKGSHGLHKVNACQHERARCATARKTREPSSPLQLESRLCTCRTVTAG